MLQLSHLSIIAFSVLTWLVQFVVTLLWLFQHYAGDSRAPAALKFGMVINFCLGVALAMLLVRALYWHPRSKAQVAAALRKERRRVARELHDHVGSQIVNAMMLIDSEENRTHPVMQTLEQCMLDLRLLVDVMSDHKGNLAEKLGALRHRVQPVLDKRGIALQWVMDVDRGDSLPRSMRARELCRIVQEAVSNVLQHSGATQLLIELRPFHEGDAGQWLLRVKDNGVGMPPVPRFGYSGRGLAHMKRRALRAGGKLQIIAEEGEGMHIVVVISPGDFLPTVAEDL